MEIYSVVAEQMGFTRVKVKIVWKNEMQKDKGESWNNETKMSVQDF